MFESKRLRTACFVFALCTPSAITLRAQTFTMLHSFDGADGSYPYSTALVQSTDGNLYGTTYEGGSSTFCAYGCGTVFKITTGGFLTTVHSFGSFGTNSDDGVFPIAGLVQATNGNLYGTTYLGGADSVGAIYEVNSGGTLVTLYSFCAPICPEGSYPQAALVQATNGDFYGTTLQGGANDDGTIFRITPSGALTVLYNFDAIGPSISYAGLIQGTDGNLYGTTQYGGTYDEGTIFKITPSGKLTMLYEFGGPDGSYPDGALVQGTDGNFYGTAGAGGTYGEGTVFKITPSGKLTTLHYFCAKTNCDDGAGPEGALVQATDGNFYGVTAGGGTSTACSAGCGTVFKITAQGRLTTLHSFDSTDGAYPFAGLFQSTDGILYGLTWQGGLNNYGTVFSLAVGLEPFVETLPTSGKVGAPVRILGTNLTGATAVSFNGTAATFTVVSSTLINTTVPAGATTGFVTVVTPSGTLQSNVKFRVRP